MAVVYTNRVTDRSENVFRLRIGRLTTGPQRMSQTINTGDSLALNPVLETEPLKPILKISQKLLQ